jgi:hypothetical protein
MDKQSAIKLPFNFKILPTNEKGVPGFGPPFIALLNPEQFSVREELQWHNDPPIGLDGTDPAYVNTRPRTFTIDFLLDGTGVNTNGAKIPVTAQVALFRATTASIQSLTHRPNYLMVQYGTFINICVMNSSTITYTMFDLAGLPIRAKISATFTERKLGTLSAILNMLSSPDLTHKVKTQEGDLLPVLTQTIYKNQYYYLQVAAVNGLTNFRKPFSAGQELIFPPIAAE